jgi:uncharacterized membrane protein
LATRGRQILLAYGLIFCLLASRPHVHSIYYQYSSTLLPFVMALLPLGVVIVSRSTLARKLGLEVRRTRLALLAAVAIASLLTSWKFGVFVENSAFRLGTFHSVHLEHAERLARYESRYRFLATKVLPRIPTTASVRANRVLLPHVTNRQEVYMYPLGNRADYHLIYLDSLKDESARSLAERRSRGEFETVVEGHGMVLLKRMRQSKEPKEG